MKLVLRSTPSSTGNWLHRLGAALVRWRLCSQFCHGGVVVDNKLLQSNAARGLYAPVNWDPSKWTVIDLGTQRDNEALALFEQRKGAPYDWLGVLGFALPWVRGKSDAMYCFEWCAIAMGVPSERWMTPEKLLVHIVKGN